MNQVKNVLGLGAKLGLVVVAIVFMSLPALSMAASYGYVNSLGNVSMVVADNPMIAIATAPNIATHSGVILLNTQVNSDLLNDRVIGL